MGTHYWLFPWFAIVSGALSLLIAIAAGRKSFNETQASIVPRGFLFVWGVVVLIGVAITLNLGALVGAPWVESRGFVLGAGAGAAAAWMARRSSDQNFWLAPAMIGLLTAAVGCGQQWFNPGEISGLMSVAAGCAVSLLCLGTARPLYRPPTARRVR